MTKKSFILHKDSLGILDQLSNEQAGLLFKAIKKYHNGDDLELDDVTSLIFYPFKAQFDRDIAEYEKTVNRNKVNGSKGGRPKNPKEPKEPSGLNGLSKEPKKADSDKDKDSGKDNKKTIKRFVHPNEKQINDYAREGNLNLTGFFDYYTGNGWKVGRNAMKDWQATARNWSRNQYKQVQGRQTKDFNKTDYSKIPEGFES